MDLHCIRSSTARLGSETFSNNSCTLEFPTQAKVSCPHYNAKLQHFLTLGCQDGSYDPDLRKPNYHQQHKLYPERRVSLPAMQHVQVIPLPCSAAVHVG